ncbi:MAG: speB [Peptococcaceae bacterium]|nr:speB [Peptococcaceae bacterium]
MHEYMYRPTGFMGTRETYEEAQAVLVGLPMDFTVSLRPGTRMGPQQIRNVSFGIEDYSVYLDRSLNDISFYDAGDVALPFGNVAGSLQRMEEVAAKIFADKKFPLFLGGEHLVTYPLIKACHKFYPDLVVIHFDAHADLREDYEGEEQSHATVINKVAKLLGPKRVYQFGIRSGIKEEFEFAKEYTHMYVDEIFPALEKVVGELKDRPVFVTLDIDVVDPAFAPGTGTPEPGGCTARELLSAIHTMKTLNVVGMDIVEVSPLNDESERTAFLAAKLVREALLAYLK